MSVRLWQRLIPYVLALLALAGLLVSFYLTMAHYRQFVPACHVVKGCELVTTSRYSTIAGVPVALIGLVFFAVSFYLAIALVAIKRRAVTRLFDIVVGLGALAGLVFFLLQALVLKAYCFYCLLTEVIAVLLWLGSFLPRGDRRTPLQRSPDPAVPEEAEATGGTDRPPQGEA